MMATEWQPFLFGIIVSVVVGLVLTAPVSSAALCIMFFVELMKYLKNKHISDFILEQNLWFRWIVIIGLIVSILVYGEYGVTFDSNQFIYFQF